MLRVFLMLSMGRHGLPLEKLHENAFDGTAEVWSSLTLRCRQVTRFPKVLGTRQCCRGSSQGRRSGTRQGTRGTRQGLRCTWQGSCGTRQGLRGTRESTCGTRQGTRSTRESTRQGTRSTRESTRQGARGTRQAAGAALGLRDRRHYQAFDQVDGLSGAQLVGGLHHVIHQAAAAARTTGAGTAAQR
jgi:hypothetical protein